MIPKTNKESEIIDNTYQSDENWSESESEDWDESGDNETNDNKIEISDDLNVFWQTLLLIK
jgi:hypothetical protein